MSVFQYFCFFLSKHFVTSLVKCNPALIEIVACELGLLFTCTLQVQQRVQHATLH